MSEEKLEGPPLSAVRKAGGLLFVSGQVGIDRGRKYLSSAFLDQMRQAIDNLSIVLSEHGSSLEDVVKTTVVINSREYLDEMNEVYRSRFPRPYPARTTMVAGLARDDLLVEIEAVAHSLGATHESEGRES